MITILDEIVNQSGLDEHRFKLNKKCLIKLSLRKLPDEKL